MDSTDEGVCGSGRFRLIVVTENLGLGWPDGGKSMTVDLSDVAVDGGTLYSDTGL